MFIEKPSIIRKWFLDKGYTGTYYDVQFAYFQTLSNLIHGTLYDHIYDRMIQLGFSGTLRDCLNAFFMQKMNQTEPKIAERLFWRDSSLDFSLGFTPVEDLEHTDGTVLENTDGTTLENTGT